MPTLRSAARVVLSVAFLVALACLISSPSSARAQLPTVVLSEGDLLPNGQTIGGGVPAPFGAVATNNVGGYVVGLYDGSRYHLWGNARRGPGSVLIGEIAFPRASGMNDDGQIVHRRSSDLYLDDELLLTFDGPFPDRWSPPGFFIREIFPKTLIDEVGGIWCTAEIDTPYPSRTRELLRGDETDLQRIVGTDEYFDSVIHGMSFDVSAGGHYIVTSESGGLPQPQLDGQTLIQIGDPIPAGQGGLPGETWTEFFHHVAINDDLDWLIAATTSAPDDRNEVIARNGSIVYREGDALGGEVLGGTTGVETVIRELYLTESGDIGILWPVVEGSALADAVVLNDEVIAKAGDFVDLDGDGTADDVHITEFPPLFGLSSASYNVAITDRGSRLDVYMVATVEIGGGTLPETRGAFLRLTLPGSPLPPEVASFVATPSAIVPGETSTLSWDVEAAAGIEIDLLGPVDPVRGNAAVQPVASTTYTLTATNDNGSATSQATVNVVPFILDLFQATPGEIDLGQSTTLSWQVRGTATVTLEGFGPQPLVGSIQVQPDQSRVYVLRVSEGGLEETATATVLVGQEGLPTPISFSWSDSEVPGMRPAIAPFVPFSVFVVADSPEDGIQSYEFQLTHSSCISVIGQTLPPNTTVTSSVFPGERNYLVEAGSCLAGDSVVLLELQALALDQVCIETGVMDLGAIDPSNFVPPSYGSTDCLDLRRRFTPGILPSLRLQEPGVSAVVVGATARQLGSSIQLSWTVSSAEDPKAVTIWRTPEKELGSAQNLISLSGDEARATGEYEDRDVTAGVSYVYSVVADFDGFSVTSEPIAITLQADRITTRTRLLGNVPNPFNPQTEIRFELARSGQVQLEILDAAGRRVRHADLAMEMGTRGWIWNGLDDAGREVSSGVYYVRLTAGATSDVRRMALVR